MISLFNRKFDENDYIPHINGTSFTRGQDTVVFEVNKHKNLVSFEVMVWQRKNHAFMFMSYDFDPHKFIINGDDGLHGIPSDVSIVDKDGEPFKLKWNIEKTFPLEDSNVLMRVFIKDRVLTKNARITIKQQSEKEKYDEEEKRKKIEQWIKYEDKNKKNISVV